MQLFPSLEVESLKAPKGERQAPSVEHGSGLKRTHQLPCLSTYSGTCAQTTAASLGQLSLSGIGVLCIKRLEIHRTQSETNYGNQADKMGMNRAFAISHP